MAAGRGRAGAVAWHSLCGVGLCEAEGPSFVLFSSHRLERARASPPSANGRLGAGHQARCGHVVDDDRPAKRLLHELPTVKGFRVLDTWAPLTAEVPGPAAAGLASALLDALARGSAVEQPVAPGTWRLAPLGNGAWELTLSHEGEPFERLTLPESRLAPWSELMEELQRAAG